MTFIRPALLVLVPLLLTACGADVDPEPEPEPGPHAADAGLEPDAGTETDAGTEPAPDAGTTPPADIFFVGNSFTQGGNVPALVHDLAVYAGFPEPNVGSRAVGGQSLQGHRADLVPEGAPARVGEGWDVVVLQELSTRPTDQVGPAEQFKEDATWFYDLAKSARPTSEVILYETWARRAGHALYNGTFESPAQMQAELRFHYNDAALRYIPENSWVDRKSDVRVAPAGDAWELHLAGGENPRLHGSDDYHANDAGAYLNALVIYSTVYRRRAEGQVPLLSLDEATARALQAAADGITLAEGVGAVEGVPESIDPGEELLLDLGPLPAPDWHPLSASDLTAGPLTTATARPTSALTTTWGFTGVQEGGSSANTLGLPGDVSRDTLWVGSFDGHAQALTMEARLVVRGLEPGSYRFELFASRLGDDGGLGRLTRYRIEDEIRDLDVADNTSHTAVFDEVSPDARGEVVLRVSVSPDGTARFAYLGALRITATD